MPEKTKDAPAVREKKTSKGKVLDQLTIPTIYYILKEFSSPKAPLSAKDIQAIATDLTGTMDFKADRIKLKLNMLSESGLTGDSPVPLEEEDLHFKNAMNITFGGEIIEVKNEDEFAQLTRKKGAITRTHIKYYFRPFLDNADINMICATIASNRYLTQAEKDYLLFREKVLGQGQLNQVEDTDDYRASINTQALPQKPKTAANAAAKEKVASRKARTTQDMLLIFNRLYEAIRHGYQIKMTYARYAPSQATGKNSKVAFTPVRAGQKHQEYFLNPYATLSHGGELYLIATLTDDPDQPRHFRIDRIYDFSLIKKSDEEGQATNAKIEYQTVPPLPELLKPYFKKAALHRKPQLPEFDGAKYTAAHPLMAIAPNEEGYIDCCLDCNEKALPLLIDTFGPNISIRPSLLDHADDSLTYYFASIQGVHAASMRTYCVMNHRQFQVVYPESLRLAVIEQLEESLKDLKESPTFSEDDIFS